ncbi:MAG TPA: hypothetical protein VJW73_13645 [Gemmatimonadaceae bacterium]|nr:hypothetical protein [Gemmatimonadaceae bacterium]
MSATTRDSRLHRRVPARVHIAFIIRCSALTAAVACIPMSSGRAQAQQRPLTRMQVEAQQACRNAIDTRPGYHARRVGTPVRHGAKQWDVAVTVRRDGSETLRVTCRYNAANEKVTLRPR